MPAFEDQPLPVPAPKEPFLSERPYQAVAVDSKYLPSTMMLQYVEGMNWTIPKYFRAILTKDTDISPQQTNLEAVYQQYQLIYNAIFKVADPLTTGFDAEKGEHTLSGSSILYPGLKSNKGDMFYADIGDGRVGLFEITSVEAPSIFKDGTLKINYQLVDYVRDHHDNDFKAKTVSEAYYVKDFLNGFQNPIVIKSDYEYIEILRKAKMDLRTGWFNKHYRLEPRSFPVPKQSKTTYDPYLMRVLEHFLPSNTREASRRVMQYTLPEHDELYCGTLWDSLVRADDVLLYQATKQFDCIPVAAFPANVGYVSFGTLLFSKFRMALWPKTGEWPVTEHYPLDSPYNQAEVDQFDLQVLVTRRILNGDEVPFENQYIPTVHPVGIDDYYILSQFFYEQAEYGQSKLELQTWNYLKRRAMDLRVLVELCEDVPNWGALESYYYVPVLLFLIDSALRGF